MKKFSLKNSYAKKQMCKEFLYVDKYFDKHFFLNGE